MDNKVKRSIRLSIAVADAVQNQAEIRGISQYALLELCVHQGLAKLSNDNDIGTILKDVSAQIGALNARINYLVALNHRVLFTSVSSYIFARLACSGLNFSDDEIASEVEAAFQRQINIALGDFDERQ